jgi:hypothetical protein
MQRTSSLWLSALLCLASCSTAAKAQEPTGKLLAFDPLKHGFNFANQWDGELPVDLPVLGRLDLAHTACGLSGGMSMAAMDTFLLAAEIPDFTGAPGTPPSGSDMRDYVRGRQLDVFKADDGYMVRRLLEWTPRPTSSSVLGSSLQALTDRQFQRVVVRQIDAGHPVNLCLLRSEALDLLPDSLDKLTSAAVQKNHQVLAIGYRRCAATAGMTAHWAVDAYDPDYPDQIMSLHFGDRGRAETPRLDAQGHVIDDPTGRELASFRAFFAMPYTHKRPPWAPANARLADASVELPRIDDPSAAVAEPVLGAADRSQDPVAGTAAAASTALTTRLDAMDQRFAAIEARLRALEGKATPGDGTATESTAAATVADGAPPSGSGANSSGAGGSGTSGLSKEQIEALRKDPRCAGGLHLEMPCQQVPNAELKGRTGRLLVVYPKDAQVKDEVSVYPPGEAEKYLTYGNGAFTTELIPGRYAIVVNKTRCEGIAIAPRTDTRLVLGALRLKVGASTEWQVFAPGGKAYATYGKGPHDVGLVPGDYEIEINKQREKVAIKAGEVFEY